MGIGRSLQELDWLDTANGDELEAALFGMGCFWGAEKLFRGLPGVVDTTVGYSGGWKPDPTYAEVCTSATGHAEVVLILFDQRVIGYGDLVKVFFENHDPTQYMRQGNDIGPQYRSAIYCMNDAQMSIAVEMKERYQKALDAAGLGEIMTEIGMADAFYPAEEYHQRYLEKNPYGYCGIRGTGVKLS